jgi:endonuclease/exonuclease/phosphatase family metal-dependent hydrolase
MYSAHRRARLALCTSLLLLANAAPAPAQTREPLIVMSFNLRYGTAPDGPNHWNERRQMVFDVIRQHDPDVLGVQEALDGQLDEIVAALPGYAVVGVGRDDGRRGGEYSAVLFRSSRLRVAEAGTFWLSDTPDVPGSATWGNRITRVCTWARFIDRDGRGFWHFNLHLDHESQRSRERSTVLLRDRVARRSVPHEPVIITGDFNAGEQNPALATLLRPEVTGAGLEFVDTYRVRHPSEQQVGTYTAFVYGRIEGEKVDYVLVPAGTEVLEAEIVRWSRGERYPSDHFPVIARVRLKD